MIGRDILGIEDLSREDIETILETAERMQEIGTREVKKVPTLRGRTLINLFFEHCKIFDDLFSSAVNDFRKVPHKPDKCTHDESDKKRRREENETRGEITRNTTKTKVETAIEKVQDCQRQI